jgi:hypothetical protein
MAAPARVAVQTFHQPTNQPTNQPVPLEPDALVYRYQYVRKRAPFLLVENPGRGRSREDERVGENHRRHRYCKFTHKTTTGTTLLRG